MNILFPFVIKLLAILVLITNISASEVPNDSKVGDSKPLKSCDVRYSCSSGIYYCPDSGHLDMYTSWYPSPSNPAGCSGNAISFDIVASTPYYYQNITMIGPQYGKATLSLPCNTGQKYYQYITNQKNSNWDCSVTIDW